jgi:hypothetical protein
VPAFPRRPLNPFLWRSVDQQSQTTKHALQLIGGWPYYAQFYNALHAEKIAASPLTIERLERVADAVGFPRDQIFLDEAVSR